MKKRVYIETTVVSYLAARPSRDLVVAGHQEAAMMVRQIVEGEGYG